MLQVDSNRVEETYHTPPGRTVVFVAVPIKYTGDETDHTKRFFQQLLKCNNDPNRKEFYVVVTRGGVNAPWSTSHLAQDFIDHPTAEWFLLWSDDLISTPDDIHRLLVAAEAHKADVISGLCVIKMMANREDNRKRYVISGNFYNDKGVVRMSNRGMDISDMDVKTGTIMPCDFVGGGCALFHRRVLDALRPEKNNGLAYWCYDLQDPAYDIRIFQRIKEKGFKVMQHCGVVFGHVGSVNYVDKDGKVTEHEFPFTFWDLPSYKVLNEENPKTEEIQCLTMQ